MFSGHSSAQRTPSFLDQGGVSLRAKHDHVESPSETDLPLSQVDGMLTVLLLCCGLALYLPGLGMLEFFRHTEADRTLIAWAMVERSDYLVPHILGSVILTKPPLFYWLIAASMQLFAGTEEWIARLPSAMAAVALLCAQFLFLRLSGAPRGASLLGAVVLGTSMFFLNLGSVAEIDMAYGFLSATALYLCYLGIARESWSVTLLGYIVAALAFLTKGPPVILFYAVSSLCFYLWWRRQAGQGRSVRNTSVLDYLGAQLIGALAFSAIISAWLFLLASEVGWNVLKSEFEREIFGRVFEESAHEHGPLFYVPSLVGGMLPWSLFLVALLVYASLRGYRSIYGAVGGPDLDKAKGLPAGILVFSAITFLSALVMLSLAEGKSSRYLFPVYAFAANIIVWSMYQVVDTAAERWLFRAARFIAPLFAVLASLFGIFGTLPGVASAHMLLAGVALSLAFVLLWVAARRFSRQLVIVSLVLIVVAFQVGERLVYSEYRNETRSVRQIVAEVHQVLPPGVKLYTVEMFERWIVYYLKRDGRFVERFTADDIAAPATYNGRVYFLLSYGEEAWRVQQLLFYDPTVKIIRELSAGKDHLLLIETAPRALYYLAPHSIIPTIPSRPYYYEASLAAAKTS